VTLDLSSRRSVESPHSIAQKIKLMDRGGWFGEGSFEDAPEKKNAVRVTPMLRGSRASRFSREIAGSFFVED
jgi:hypothetical protein